MSGRKFLAFGALSLLAVVPAFVACGSSNSSAQGSSADAGPDTSVGDDDDGSAGDDSASFQPVDAALLPSQCLLFPSETDPVGLCLQKTAILGLHAQLTSAGLPANWSVDTLAPAVTDAGAVAHDPADDVAYGAALAAYAASAAAYRDTEISAIVASDLPAVAHLVEAELATLPADYDGALYLHLRRFAAGLRAAGLLADANAIDLLAVSYGEAIYTTYFHPLTPTADADDAGSSGDAGGDGGVVDAGGTDAGSQGDGILGTPSAGGVAYRADKAASGMLALFDMATRAAGGSLFAVDAGVDAATLADPADAARWSQAAAAVFAHLVARARDTSGLYFGSLVTSADAAHDTVTDTGAFGSETQGAVAVSFVRAAELLTTTPLAGLAPKSLSAQTVAILGALQATPSVWDTATTDLTFVACNAPSPPVEICGSGYFLGLDPTKTTQATDKSVRANALLFSALLRANLLGPTAEMNDLVPLRVLFAPTKALVARYSDDDAAASTAVVLPTLDTFFSQVANQAAFTAYVSHDFTLTQYPDGGGLDDGGTGEPFARYYSAGATAAAIEAMNDQWLGLSAAPSFFQ